MSVTRIICETCGFPVAFCRCTAHIRARELDKQLAAMTPEQKKEWAYNLARQLRRFREKR